MSTEEMVGRAKGMRPNDHLTEHEVHSVELRAEMLAPFKSMQKEELLDVIFSLLIQLSRQ